MNTTKIKGEIVALNFRPRPLIAAMFGLFFLGYYKPVSADGTVASEPAVAEPNAKLTLQGLSLDGKGAGIATGLFTAPLGHSFGAQIDVQAGGVNSEAYWGTGAHLFWRDPNVGLLGVAYSYQQWSNANFGWLDHNTQIIKTATLHRGGIQGELYLSHFTLSGYAGYQDGNTREGAFGHLKLNYYATDDFAIHLAGDHIAGRNMIRGGLEYRPNLSILPNLAFFAEGGYGTHEYGMATAGVRYYFGKSTPTLIQRDRRSDPDHIFVDNTQAFNEPNNRPAPSATVTPTVSRSPSPTPSCSPQPSNNFCGLPPT